MNVEIKIDTSVKEPFAVIYAGEVTDEVTRAVELLKKKEGIITAKDEDKISILKADDIYMVRIEEGKTFIYGKSRRWKSSKRLYELKEDVGSGFMQISKACFINLSFMDSVETTFGGMMSMILKNGLKEYVSRKYLPDLKAYLGI